MSDDNKIIHYGVKGMKWGRRRPVDSTGRVRAGDSEDFIKSRQLKRTPNRQLSTPELERLNKRLQLERSNRDLASVGPVEKLKKGNALVNTVLAVGITANAALAFANSPAGKAIKDTIFKK